jgi:PHD/YefM family antitoxin component YafN of YafNO toxin-antitoxin module
MNFAPNLIIQLTEANQNFSKVKQLVDKNGLAVIVNDTEPEYVVLSFSDYTNFKFMRQKCINTTVDTIIAENIEALNELAK